MKTQIFFIAERVKTKLTPPIKLLDNVILRKPNEEETALIKYLIKIYNHTTTPNTCIYHHQLEFTYKKGKGLHGEPILNPENWYYWLIEFLDTKAINIDNVLNSLSLMKSEINWLCGTTSDYTFDKNNEPFFWSFSGGLTRPFNMFLNSFKGNDTVLVNKDIIEFQNIFEKLNRIMESSDFSFIKRAIENYEEINIIDDWSNLKIIGYSSILETLLTDYKQKTKPISQQIETKSVLINSKFHEKINFHEILGCSNETKESTIINRLYKYRNDIAHGNKIDFVDKYKMFKNHRTILYCYKVLVKRIIKFGLENPEKLLEIKIVNNY